MKTWKIGIGFGAVIGALFTVMACSSSSSSGGGGGFSCTSKGPCPNDTAPTQMQIDQCNQAQMDPNCGAKFTALANCAAANSSCDANGKSTTDQSKCMTETNAYASCLLGGVDAGGGGG